MTNSEFAYLLTLLQASEAPGAGPLWMDVSRASLSWTRFVELARFHRIIDRVLDAPNIDEFLPADVIGNLRQELFKDRLNRLLYVRALLELNRTCEIDFILLKGPALAVQLFGDPLGRHYRDLDILVPRGRIMHFMQKLEPLGFYPCPDSCESERFAFQNDLVFGHHFTLKQLSGLTIELHWRIDIEGSWRTFEDLVQRASRVRIAGQDFHCLDQVETVRFLLSHGQRHLWFRLKWLLEAKWVICRLPTEEWPLQGVAGQEYRVLLSLLGELGFETASLDVKGMGSSMLSTHKRFVLWACRRQILASRIPSSFRDRLIARLALLSHVSGRNGFGVRLFYMVVPIRMMINWPIPRRYWFLYMLIAPLFVVSNWKQVKW